MLTFLQRLATINEGKVNYKKIKNYAHTCITYYYTILVKVIYYVTKLQSN